jgi:hypothetical protein
MVWVFLDNLCCVAVVAGCVLYIECCRYGTKRYVLTIIYRRWSEQDSNRTYIRMDLQTTLLCVQVGAIQTAGNAARCRSTCRTNCRQCLNSQYLYSARKSTHAYRYAFRPWLHMVIQFELRRNSNQCTFKKMAKEKYRKKTRNTIIHRNYSRIKRQKRIAKT